MGDLGIPSTPFRSRVKECPVRFGAPRGISFLALISDNRAIGCLVDVVWYDLNGTPKSGRGHSYSTYHSAKFPACYIP